MQALSKREQQVVDLVCEGRTNSQIAEVLGISVDTVSRHLTTIFTKTGVSTRLELASGEREKLVGSLAVFEQLMGLTAEGVKPVHWHRPSERTPRSGVALRVIVRTPKGPALHELPALFSAGKICVLVNGELQPIAGIVLAWTESSQQSGPQPARMKIAGVTRADVEHLLQRCQGNKSRAAREMKLPRSTFLRILEEMEITV